MHRPTQLYIHVHAYTYTYMRTQYTYEQIYIYSCIQMYTYIHMCTRKHMCTRVHAYIIKLYIHTYIQLQRHTYEESAEGYLKPDESERVTLIRMAL